MKITINGQEIEGTPAEISELMRVERNSKVFSKLKIRKSTKSLYTARKWTDKENKFLSTHYKHDMGMREIAKYLARTETSCYNHNHWVKSK